MGYISFWFIVMM